MRGLHGSGCSAYNSSSRSTSLVFDSVCQFQLSEDNGSSYPANSNGPVPCALHVSLCLEAQFGTDAPAEPYSFKAIQTWFYCSTSGVNGDMKTSVGGLSPNTHNLAQRIGVVAWHLEDRHKMSQAIKIVHCSNPQRLRVTRAFRLSVGIIAARRKTDGIPNCLNRPAYLPLSTSWSIVGQQNPLHFRKTANACAQHVNKDTHSLLRLSGDKGENPWCRVGVPDRKGVRLSAPQNDFLIQDTVFHGFAWFLPCFALFVYSTTVWS